MKRKTRIVNQSLQIKKICQMVRKELMSLIHKLVLSDTKFF